MKHLNRLQYEASLEALKSECDKKHGALITKGRHIYAKGYNTPTRTSYQNKLVCCMHAEMSAINTFINTVVRRNNSKYVNKQCILWGKTKATYV